MATRFDPYFETAIPHTNYKIDPQALRALTNAFIAGEGQGLIHGTTFDTQRFAAQYLTEAQSGREFPRRLFQVSILKGMVAQGFTKEAEALEAEFGARSMKSAMIQDYKAGLMLSDEFQNFFQTAKGQQPVVKTPDVEKLAEKKQAAIAKALDIPESQRATKFNHPTKKFVSPHVTPPQLTERTVVENPNAKHIAAQQAKFAPEGKFITPQAAFTVRFWGGQKNLDRVINMRYFALGAALYAGHLLLDPFGQRKRDNSEKEFYAVQTLFPSANYAVVQRPTGQF